MGRVSRFFDNPGPIAFAHRGGAAEAPENTWAAFERAIKLGYRHMETDARVTADGVAVAVHDPTMDRVAFAHGKVRSMPWATLAALPLRDGGQVPRLEDLLGAWPDVCWNIDVKEVPAVPAVIAALRRTASAERVLLASFSGRRCQQVRSELGPELAIGAGRWAVAMLMGAKFLPAIPVPRTIAAAQVPISRKGIRIVDGRFLSACHARGMAVHVWTINDAPEMNRLLDLGVDGIMTDRPALLKAVMSQRGQW